MVGSDLLLKGIIMSVHGIRLACFPPSIQQDPDGILPGRLRVDYRFSPVFQSHDTGAVLVDFGNYTETELNALVQQAILDQANETIPGENFVLTDVVGGRS
jgi:hypothetical protein